MNKDNNETSRFLQKVYAWMFFGLLISGITAYLAGTNTAVYNFILMTPGVLSLILFTELALILLLGVFVSKIPANLTIFAFLLYCFMTGLSLSVIFLIYTTESISQIFFISALMFGVVSAYGYFTKVDLATMGQVLIMGLIGIVIAGFVNLFLKNAQVSFINSIIGVGVFTGLTAYDTQKIKKSNKLGNSGTPEDTKEAVQGALILYLDFINLFLRLLKLFGKKRR